MSHEPYPYQRLLALAHGVIHAPPGWTRIMLAFAYGVVCHLLFSIAVCAMIAAMFFGMSESFGRVPYPWSWALNIMLIAQFPIVHSLLLTETGSKLLSKLAPKNSATTLATTNYAIVASVQLILLFVLWTPSEIVWWRAEGVIFYVICSAYTLSWLLLIKASYDAGAEVQSGALGWMSLAQNKRPVFPDMPTRGLFRFIRQPIYVSFALTTWTVPVWTPDQLVVAFSLTAYCLLAPVLKERRFRKRYGERFKAYKEKVPYALPRIRKMKND